MSHPKGSVHYAVVDASRYDMGTARPIEVGSWWVEFLSRDEVVFQGAKTSGDIIFIRRTDYVLVAVAGGEVAGPNDNYVKILKRGRISRKKEQERARQEQELAKELTEEIAKREKRLKKDQQKLVWFPELSNFRPALDNQLQIQQKLLAQLNAAHDINKLAFEVREANKSELVELEPLRNQALYLVEQQVAAEKEKRESAVQAEKERVAAQAKRDTLAQAERKKKEEAENQVKREKEAQLAQDSSGCGCVVLIVALGLGTILVSKSSIFVLQWMVLLLHKAF